MRSMRAKSLMVGAGLILALVGTPATSAHAAVGDVSDLPNISACSGVDTSVGLTTSTSGGSISFSSGKYQDFGSQLPIVLVHGYAGKDQGQWGTINQSTSFASQLNAISDTKVATEFQYDVTSGLDIHFTDHFEPLAQTIDCISQISIDNGGLGKVIVIGYSEGSAIMHGAAALSSSDSSRHIADEIGLAITVADARSIYSANSPDFRYQAVVHTIAGDIVNNTVDAWGDITSSTDTGSDGYIDQTDAIAGYTSNTALGGGVTVVSCTHSLNSSGDPVESLSDHSCDHGNLLSSSEVQDATVSSVVTYKAALLSPLTTNGTMEMGPLSMPLVDGWTLQGPSSWGGTGSIMQSNYTDNFHSCTYDDPDDVCYERVDIDYNSSYTNSSACIGGDSVYPAITVDGVTSTCSVRGYSWIFWYFDSKKIRIRYDLAATDGASPSVMNLILSSTWTY